MWLVCVCALDNHFCCFFWLGSDFFLFLEHPVEFLRLLLLHKNGKPPRKRYRYQVSAARTSGIGYKQIWNSGSGTPSMSLSPPSPPRSGKSIRKQILNYKSTLTLLCGGYDGGRRMTSPRQDVQQGQRQRLAQIFARVLHLNVSYELLTLCTYCMFIFVFVCVCMGPSGVCVCVNQLIFVLARASGDPFAPIRRIKDPWTAQTPRRRL